MGKYLVGPNSNMWAFDKAIIAARPGDVIEVQSGFCPNIGTVVIDKSLTIQGVFSMNANGNFSYTNVLNGRIVVVGGADVKIENLWIRFDQEKTNLIYCKESSKVSLSNVVLENTMRAGEVYPVLYIDENSTGVLDRVEVKDNPNYTLRMHAEKAQLDVFNCYLNCGIQYYTSSTGTISNTKLIQYGGNVISVHDSKINIDNSYIEGGDVNQDYPAVFCENGKLFMKNSTVLQPEYEAAVYANESSYVQSCEDTFTSYKLVGSRGELNSSTIQEILYLDDRSSLLVTGEVHCVGVNKGLVDVYATNSSVIYGDTILIERDDNPAVRAERNSLIHLKNLICACGNYDILAVEELEGGEIAYRNKGGNSVQMSVPGSTSVTSEPDGPSAREQLQDMIGLTSVKREIEKMMRMVEFNQKRIAQGLEPQEQSFHSVFLGNPGTGKTTVARLIGQVLFEAGAFKSDEFKLIEASEPDFISQNVGGTAQQTLEILERAKGGVLFIDEAYALNKKDSSVNFGIEAINTILKYMEDHRGEIMIIFAGYTKEMEEFLKTNPGLTSRVPNKFVFEDYTPDEIVQIGKEELAGNQYQLEDPDYYETQVKRAYRSSLDHSNARWIRNFNEKLVKTFATRAIESEDGNVSTICNVDIAEVLGSDKYQAGDSKKEDAFEKLQKMIGIARVKEQVKDFIAVAEFNQKREEQGVDTDGFTMHSLFLGNPGTGKTTVARIVADILYQKGVIKTNKCIETSRSELVAGYIGQTAIKTREVLESALGGVLFIDEAYTLSTGGSNDFGSEAINEILKFMEDYRRDIVIIFAGYTKEMGEFLQMNSGLMSRIPHTFDFEDYTGDEIVQIGLLGLHSKQYVVDEEYYGLIVKALYDRTNDKSNGRWVRNFNDKLIMAMSKRVQETGDSDISTITRDDLDTILKEF